MAVHHNISNVITNLENGGKEVVNLPRYVQYMSDAVTMKFFKIGCVPFGAKVQKVEHLPKNILLRQSTK